MNIHLLGDSTVKSYGDDVWNFISGWGDHIGAFFTEDVKVFNYAVGGRSTRSFINEGRFLDKGCITVQDAPVGMGPALPRIEAGDYVFLQFGHNDDNSGDQAKCEERQVPLGEPDEAGIYPVIEPVEAMQIVTDNPLYGGVYYPYACGATYKGFLKYYIDTIRDKGAFPVLVTSAVRSLFENDTIQPVPGHHGGKDKWYAFPYIEAVRQLGRELKVPVLDLFKASKAMQEMLGPEDASYMHSIVDSEGFTIGEVLLNRPAKWPEEYNRRREEQDLGRVDNTHQNRIGAFVFAGLLAELMLMQHILEDKILLAPTKQVPVPDKLVPRMAEISALFNKITIFTK